MLQMLLHASILQGKPSLADGPIADQHGSTASRQHANPPRQHANPALDQHTLDQQALDLDDPWSKQTSFCAMERQRAPRLLEQVRVACWGRRVGGVGDASLILLYLLQCCS